MNLNIQNSWSHWLSTYCWQFSTGNHMKWSTNPRVTSSLPTASISSLRRGCHPTAGQHGRPRKRSTLFHLLESRWVSHGSEEICRYFWDQFSLECQVYTFHATACSPGSFDSFPTPNQLLISIFSTVVDSPILPVGFCRRIVKHFHVMNMNQNSW